MLLVAGALDAHAARRHCPDGRFVADDGSMTVMLERHHVALETSCPSVRARTQTAGKGMSVKAVWPDCAGGVRLKARVEPDCWRMRGFIQTAGVRHPFTAFRFPTCGNGIREGGEQCDGGSCCDLSCHLIEGCSQVCRSNRNCPRGARCAKRAGDCDGQGVCRQPPAACEGVLEPVCACDGRTYVNACEAARAGKTVLSEGRCRAECGTLIGKGCRPGEFCEFAPGTCSSGDFGGTCITVPDACPEVFQPVCGCDGVTYGNDCERRAKGVTKAHDGKCDCPPPGCLPVDHARDTDGDGCPDRCDGCAANEECAAGEYCDGQCEGGGLCTPRPASCPSGGNPVCGCDRKTYPNACTAAAAGVRVAHPGKCECFSVTCTPDTRPVDRDGDGCADLCLVPCRNACDCYADPLLGFPQACSAECATCGNFWECKDGYCDPRCGPVPPGQDQCPVPDLCATSADCKAYEFCSKPGCLLRGNCVPRPDACPAVVEPVCGCDGRTYGNSCEAARSGVSVASRGRCSGACGTIAGIPCPAGQFCELPAGTCQFADLGGKCVPVSPVCPDVSHPVCGCDRWTYGSDCERRAAYVQKAHDGVCGCPPLRCGPGSVEEDGDGDGCPDTCVKVACFSNADCGGRLFCSGDAGECRGAGVCQARPDACPDTWLPVCGCDSRTYGNTCLADSAGVRVARDGNCRACQDACDCESLPFTSDCSASCPRCGSFWSCENGWCKEQCGAVPTSRCPRP